MEDLHFYYVPMPNMLRKSGSFGTHWMLQKYIKVECETKCENPTPTGSKTRTEKEAQTFKGEDVVEALRAAYSGSGHPLHNGPELVDWIKKSPEFATWCQDMREGMAGEGIAIPASCGP